jgi:AcrR family transcriptional regulator
MNVNRQAARSASTRAKLIGAARALFARRGYADVATEEIVFLAVYEQVEQELTESVGGLLGVQASPFAAMRAGIRVFLEACRAPDVQRIVLIDGPAVLGWERWREVAERHGLGLMEAVIGAAIEAGEIEPLAIGPLAHLLMGALDEAALLVVRDPEATDAVASTFERLIDGLQTAR